jgi:hypothetical protein
MILNVHTPANKLLIKAPRWKDRTVLLADWKIGLHNEIVITASRKDGSRYFPESFYMSGEKVKKYPTQPHSSRKVYIVPIDDLEVLTRTRQTVESREMKPEDIPDNIKKIFFSDLPPESKEAIQTKLV